jgi:hypothetical protein
LVDADEGKDWEGDLKWKKSSRWAATAVCFVLKLWKGEWELARGGAGDHEIFGGLENGIRGETRKQI